MLNKHIIISLILLKACTAGLIALNNYVLDMTHGCYNIFKILFI